MVVGSRVGGGVGGPGIVGVKGWWESVGGGV